MHEARAIEQHVDGADRIGERVDRRAVAHVEHARIERAVAQRVDADVRRDHARTLAREPLGRRAADALRGGRDERRLASQSCFHILRSR